MQTFDILIDMKPKKNEQYGAEQIEVLEGLDPVRKRPGMYIGSTGIEGLYHLIWEVVDNAVDEAMAGYAKTITVTLLSENGVRVSDDGRGIPVDMHKQTKKSALETVMTTLHAGGKFDSGAYKVAGGLHGVGVSVVNALSRALKAEVCRDGTLYTQEYERGEPITKVKKAGSCRQTGTIITFFPDQKIFTDMQDYQWERVLERLRQEAYLNPGVRILARDERPAAAGQVPPHYTFYFEGGVKAYVRYLNRHLTPKHDTIFYVGKEEASVRVEIALQYTDDIQSREIAFANTVLNPDGGTHVTGFRAALTRVLNDFARKNNYVKAADDNLTGDDVREGLTSVISIKLPNPQFEGQTKAKLGNPEIRTITETVFSVSLAAYLEERPADARAIMEKVLLASKARKAAKAAKETILRKGALEGLMLPGKLADCQSKNASESEIFIVEGDSAGGSAKQGRDRRFQAILPLRGKILNVERARIDKMLAFKEIRALIIALGTAIAEEFDLTKLRYHKVVIMTDADVDGAHIRTLLLTLFYRYFKPVVEAGYLYIAQPPLYRIQKGKDVQYAYQENEKEKIMAKIKAEGITIQRYKGLGEMNPNQLWETTMDPEQRVMKQVTIEDAEEADHIFDILMGDEVAPRKAFIQEYAKSVKNLDI